MDDHNDDDQYADLLDPNQLDSDEEEGEYDDGPDNKSS